VTAAAPSCGEDGLVDDDTSGMQLTGGADPGRRPQRPGVGGGPRRSRVRDAAGAVRDRWASAGLALRGSRLTHPQWATRVAAVVEALPLTTAPLDAPEQPEIAPEFAAMLVSLGGAMVQVGQATNDVDLTLTRIAAAYGSPETSVVILPTVILVHVGGARATEMAPISVSSLRLDQAGRTARLVTRALRAELTPQEVLDEIAEMRSAPPRFGSRLMVVGHILLTLGFGLTLNPTLASIPAYAVLGAAVGILILLSRRLPTLSAILPVVAAFVVTLLAGLLLAGSLGGNLLRVLTPPLVTFLPGLLMTIAAIELTSNQIIAGASRIVYGLAQLALLTFGVFAALSVLGDFTNRLFLSQVPLGPWSRWVGVLLAAIGYHLFASAPRGSFKWILLCVYCAFGAQTLARLLLTPELSGFVGALVVVPLTSFLARFRTAPPSVVTTLPSLWLLVPGSVGFLGVGSLATGGPAAGQLLVSTAISLLSIAIGMLVGTGLARDLVVAKGAWLRAPGGSRAGVDE